MMKKYALFTFLLVGVLAFIPVKTTHSCGYYQMGYYVYSFVSPDLLEDPAHRPFFFTLSHFFEDWKGTAFAKEENLKEWKAFFDNQGKESDYDYLIYKSSIKDLERLRDRAFDQLSIAAKNNAIIQKLETNNKAGFLDYMIFAKTCEPLATSREFDWNGVPQVNNLAKRNFNYLIEEGLTAFHSCESDFLKMRYAFQIVRLARYAMQWEEVVQRYEALMPEVKNVNSIIRYWTMEHYAGALYNLKKRPEAAYFFSQVFNKCPSRRMAAYQSFSIKTDQEWNSTLALCKNKEEKSGLYALRAINPFGNAVEEMNSIYKLTPKSQQLELLLFREVQKLEYELLGASYAKARKEFKVTTYDYENDKSYVKFPRKASLQYLEELKKLVKTVLADKKAKRPHIWKLAKGYLEFMSGNNRKAAITFDQIGQRNSYGKAFNYQLEVFKAAVIIDDLEKIDTKTELLADKLSAKLKNIHPQGADYSDSGIAKNADYILDKLAILYQKQNKWGKAFLCHKHSFRDLLVRPDLNVVNDLIDLYDRKNTLNKFEQQLTRQIFFKREWSKKEQQFIYVTPNKDIKNQLIEIKGTILLGANQLDNAIAAFETLPDAYKNQTTPVDPSNWRGPNNSRERFNVSDNDPFHLYTNSRKKTAAKTTFNKLDIAKRLLKLEKLTKTDPNNAPEYYFQLGNAHFQMSYYGKSWRALDYYWTSAGDTEIYPNVYETYGGFHSRGNQSFRINEIALSYFEEAISLVGDKDSEWGAKACFMASACSNPVDNYGQKYYFKKLKNEYGDTDFYQQVIKECATFAHFTNK